MGWDGGVGEAGGGGGGGSSKNWSRRIGCKRSWETRLQNIMCGPRTGTSCPAWPLEEGLEVS